MNKPFFSVIIVSLNAEKLILNTISSVLNQKFQDFEIIVKDGISIDDTIKFIPESDKIIVLVNSDSGIYDAMNQAVSSSSGQFLIFMNCGDTFYSPDVLEKIYSFVIENKIKINYKDENYVIYTDYTFKSILHKLPKKLSKFYLYKTPLNHQSMFFSRKIFEIPIKYDTRYRILSDYDLTLKLYNSNTIFMFCECITCDYLGDGISESKSGIKTKKKEFKIIRKKYFNKLERFKFRILIFISFKRIRQFLASNKSPKFINVFYRFLVNKFNKR